MTDAQKLSILFLIELCLRAKIMVEFEGMLWGNHQYCTACQCLPLRGKFMECSVNQALSLLMKHLVIGQRLKPNFSAFHWSPRSSLVSIGQHFIATRVVHLPKSTETSLITKSDQSGPNHQLLQLCKACTTWSNSDQAVRSCNSWFLHKTNMVPLEAAMYIFNGELNLSQNCL